MQESLVKVVLLLVGIVCLAIGALILIMPGWFLVLSQAETLNIGWLRITGAGLLALQGLGLLTSSFRRRDTNPLLGFAALATTVQAGSLWYSVFAGEFSAATTWPVILASIGATLGAVLLWFAWVARRRSLKGMPSKARGKARGSEDAGAGEEAGHAAGDTSANPHSIRDGSEDAAELDPVIPTDDEVEAIAGKSPREREQE